MDVDLYVYDLSKGLARQFSTALLGTYIDAVYHTSIVFGGVEIFFGLGVQTSIPKSTHHGAPMEIIRLGKTSLPEDVISEYIESLKQIYTPESYDLFLHNCNNFSNDLAMFLVGKNIPEHITSLPETVLRTPFGQMLKPQLDSAMRSMTQAPLPPSSAPAARAVRPPAAVTTNGVDAGKAYAKNEGPRAGTVHNVSSLVELEGPLKQAAKTCSVIFFTSATCPPCKILYPLYDELAAGAGHKGVFIKADVGKALDVGRKYGITATPTFMTFLHGQKENEWRGADGGRLRGNVELLLRMAQHPHMNLRLPQLLGAPLRPVVYSKTPPLEKLVTKMGDAGRDSSVIALKEFVAVRNGKGAKEAPLPDLRAFASFVQNSLVDLPEENAYPIVDLFRTALADPRVSGYFAEEQNHSTVAALLNHVNAPPGKPQSYALRLVTLHAACNLFSSSLFSKALHANPTLTSHLTTLVTNNLPDHEHPNIRIGAASLTYNLASLNHKQRTDSKTETEAETIPAEEQLQLVAALVEAILTETDSADALRRMLQSLGLLLHCALRDGEVLDYVKAVEAAEVVRGKAELFPKEMLVAEIGEELLGKGL